MVSLTPRTSGWLIGVLFVSLALNMFVGGVWLGHRLFHDRGEYAEAHKRKFSMMSFAERMAGRLSPAEREQYMAVIDGYRGEMAAAERQMHEARGKVRDALSAVPFDPQALSDALAASRESFTNVQKVFHSALAAAAAALDTEGRQKLARWDRKKDRDGGGDDDDGDDGGGKAGGAENGNGGNGGE